MTWSADAPQGNEARKIKYLLPPYTRGRGLDLGCGNYKPYKHFIGVDNGHHAEVFNIKDGADVHVQDCADLSLFGDGSMDFVFSSHLLEHIEDYKAALKEWWRVIRIGGHLVLYLPHKDLYPNIGQPGANPDHKHDFLPDDIVDALLNGIEDDPDSLGCDLVDYELRNGENEYSFFIVFRKRDDRQFVDEALELKDPAVCVVRFGAFGDLIQASSLLPQLKGQRYRIVFMTTPKGHDILREDPNIDEFFIIDDDQVPNIELGLFFKAQAQRFMRFINLCESVEGTLLAVPGRANHSWPSEMRHKYMNVNYLQFMFDIADVPFDPQPSFYPTQEEERWAEGYLADKPAFRIMWVLSGSSRHKFYPHQDAVIESILENMPGACVILSGDEACKILEYGWENHSRVFCTSGEMSIRQTLTLANHVDLVIGCETGVLNSVSFKPDVAKVCLLSHSSHENLTRDWKNTVALAAPEDDSVPICGNRPCHRLHYDNEFCPTHEETGASACQFSIVPQRVYDSILPFYEISRL